MKNRNSRSVRVLSVLIATLFTAQQAVMLSACATNITGIANTQGGTGSTYNIDPTGIIKNTGFGYRKYKDFNLSEGDIANLIYKYGKNNVETFINLVDNQIRIDGIVNTMRDGSFYNGRALFVSPNGMVVGASGVLNVGSLGVYTPNNATYNSYKNNPSSDLSALTDLNNNKNGYVTINGKVIATQDIDVATGRIEVPGKMIAGTGNNLVATGRERAEEIFNNIVNTSNLVSADQMSSRNGVITISSGIGTDVTGIITNYGKGSTNFTNVGHQGINISGTVTNHNGDFNITNSNNDIYIASTGKVKNNGGTMKFVNSGNGIYIVDGSKVENNGKLSIYNGGPEGIHMAGSIDNTGDAEIYNTNGIVSIDGSIKNRGNATITNDGTQLNVTGTIDNSNGTLKMVNNGAEGLHLVSGSTVNSEGIELYNSGHDGLDMHGVINNNGNATIRNTETANGDYGLGVYGTFNNSNGNVEMVNDGDAGLNVYGTLKNTNGETKLINHGKGGMNVTENGLIDTQGLEMNNVGENGINVWGTIKNKGELKLVNTGNGIHTIKGSKIENNGKLDIYNGGAEGIHMEGSADNIGDTEIYNTNGIVSISGSLKNKGNTTITNDGTQLNVTGTIDNSNGTLKMINNGADGLHLVSTSTINSEGIELYNSGNDGLDMHGVINNNGNATIRNTETANGDYGLGVYGTFNNSNGDVEMVNDGDAGLNVYGTLKNTNGQTKLYNHGKGGLNVAKNGLVDTQGIEMINNGAAGMNVWGTVKNEGDGYYTNNVNSLDVKESGKMYNTKGTAQYYNNGVNGLVISGTVENEGTTLARNDNGYLSIGGSFSNKGTSSFENNGSQFNVSGKVNNTNGKLTMVNKGAKGFYVVSTGEINSEGLAITNYGEKGLTVNGKINNNGNAVITNTKEGVDGTKISGTITNNKGVLSINNEGNGGLNLYDNGKIVSYNLNKDSLKMTNTGENGMNIRGDIDVLGNSSFYNSESGKAGMNIIGKIKSENGSATYLNNGEGGLNVYGEAHHTGGRTTMTNNGAKGLNVASTGVVFADYTTLTNNGNDGMNINGRVQGITIDLNNTTGGVKGLNINGRIEQGIIDPHAPRGYLNINNKGKEGLNVKGNIHAYDEIYMTNTGANGTYIDSSARITGEKNIAMNDTSVGGTRVQGLVKAHNNITLNEKGGNVVIGDKTDNDNYMTAGKDIRINVTDGSILNYGVEKVLLKAGGDLTMDVTDGTIGLPVGQLACEGTGCVGIGPKSEGSRDFTKSVNANVKGKVNAKTADTTAAKQKDLVINYAAIDSDMNIDTIKADGRVILTVDDDYGKDNNGKRYNMVNVNTDPTKTNVEGKGISMIANGSIGTKETDANGEITIITPVTFIQTGAEEGYSMDALANENIYLYENSYNDANYGRDKEIKTNKVCTMIAREGDLDVEFAGNTKIENITAEGDLTVVTRGKTLEIENLGHITDESVIPNDYFGPRDYGQKDGGYMEEDYRDEALPNNAKIAALDINHNLRPTDELVDEGHEAWADSTVKVKNAVLDNGKLDITADHVLANGIEVDFGKNGYTKVRNNDTNKVIGSDGIPTGHAVRPDDVKEAGRNELERNYYYHKGDGDGRFNGIPSDVDPDNGVIDATPLEIADPEAPNVNEDGRTTFIKQKDTYVEAIDKRQYMRYNVSNSTNPVLMEKNTNVDRLLDVSRGGIAVNHNNTLKVGDVIPVHLSYGDLDIKANAKVVSATTTRAGAEFVDIDQGVANQLLYLNMLLERNMQQLASAGI